MKPLELKSVLVFEEVDDYSHIRIIDVFPERVRYLYFEESIQGELSLDMPSEPVLEYIALMIEGVKHWVRAPQTVCIGGLGTASIAHKAIKMMGLNALVDIVEKDPRVIGFARNYFLLPESQGVHEGDFRTFIEQDGPNYDAIFIDCYSAYSVPPHLMTSEFMEAISHRLNKGGVASFNLWGSEGNSIWKEQLKTIFATFQSSAFLACPQDRNLVVFASNQKLSFPDGPLFWRGNAYPVRMLKPARNAYFPSILSGVEILSDENLSRILSQHAILF